METKERTMFKVLMFPWLAHGHISPYLELSRRLSKRNFQIYFCSTAINLNYIKRNSCEFPIQLVELHLPYSPDLPPEYHTTKNLPSNLMPTLMSAFQMSKSSFSNIITMLSPDLLIYDSFHSWAVDIASLHNIPSVHFYTSGAATMSFFHHQQKHGWFQSLETFPFPEIYFRDHEKRTLLALANSNPQASEDFASKSFELSSEIVLIKSCRELERKYLDHFSLLTRKKIVTLGPLIQESTHHIEKDQANIINNWLNQKNQFSVVFVCFGSEYFLSKEEREEIAHGLELSKVNFIWVIRFPPPAAAGNSITIAEGGLPEGFLEKVKDRGIVVDGWAEQSKILQHQSIGGFLSHCGWSSIMESLYHAVPLIAMPVQLDQPTNARLMVEIGVGIEVMRDENGKMNREEIAKVIKEMMVDQKGKEIKVKAKDLSKQIRMEEEQVVDEALEELRNVCKKHKQPSP